MVGGHHRLDGHEFDQSLGDGEGQGSLASCSLWDSKELDTTERLNHSSQQRRPVTWVTCTNTRVSPRRAPELEALPQQ